MVSTKFEVISKNTVLTNNQVPSASLRLNQTHRNFVFSGERLLFETLLDAQLKIHVRIRGAAIPSNKILCKHLCVFLQ